MIAVVVCALLLAAIGLVGARIDVALLALPLIAVAALSWDRRPYSDGQLGTRLTITESDGAEVRYQLELTPPPGVETIVLRYTVLGGERRELAIAAPLRRQLTGVVPLLHSGPQELVRFDYRLVSPEGVMATLPGDPIIGERVIAPDRAALQALPLPHRLQGMVGSHESARVGSGGEFRDIHPFTPGDRLRRIDWKATARRGQNVADLYVRRTNAAADATVLIVMDSRDDIGEQVAQWSANDATEKGLSSLDVAREAASSIATAYIAAGDRVGFQDLSSRTRMLGHSGGDRHLWRLLRSIETTAPSSVAFRHERPPIVPPGALVYLLSSLLDDRAPTLALTWLGNGHRVIAVDVLPPARFARSNRYERVAHRVLMMERDDRIRTLRSRGVELLAWRAEPNEPSLAARLALLSRARRGAGPTGVRR